jgi:hypothetical protein
MSTPQPTRRPRRTLEQKLSDERERLDRMRSQAVIRRVGESIEALEMARLNARELGNADVTRNLDEAAESMRVVLGMLGKGDVRDE